MALNLMTPIRNSEWRKYGLASSTITYQNDYSCTYSVQNTSADILHFRLTENVAGKTFRVSFDSFVSSDGAGEFEVQCIEPDDTDVKLAEVKGNINEPFGITITTTPTCVQLRVYFMHQYSSTALTAPATLTLANVSMEEVEIIGGMTVHKVSQKSLPAEVQEGTEHLYYVLSPGGTSAAQYISKKNGSLIPVKGASSSVYENPCTQAWIDERKQDIISLQKQGHCITFAVATDIHVRAKDGDSGRYDQVRDFIMLTDQVPIDYICCLGDIMSVNEDWDGNVEPRIEKVKDIFCQAKVPWFATRGNHDYNIDTATTALEDIQKYFCSERDWHKSITSKFPVSQNIEVL